MLSLFQTNIANSVLIQFFEIMISYTLYGSQLGQISFKVDVEPAQRFLFFVLFFVFVLCPGRTYTGNKFEMSPLPVF